MAKRSKYTGGTDVQTSQLHDQIFDQNLRILSNVQKIKFINCEFNGASITVVYLQQSIEFEDCEVNNLIIASQSQPNNFSRLSLYECKIGVIDQQCPVNVLSINLCMPTKSNKKGISKFIATSNLSVNESYFNGLEIRTGTERQDYPIPCSLFNVNVSNSLSITGTYNASLENVTAQSISFNSHNGRPIKTIQLKTSTTPHLNLQQDFETLTLLSSTIDHLTRKEIGYLEVNGSNIKAIQSEKTGSSVVRATKISIKNNSKLSELVLLPDSSFPVLIQDSEIDNFTIEGAIHETSNKLQIINSNFQSFKIQNCELSNEVLLSRIRISNAGLIVENSDITRAKFQSVQWEKSYKVNTRRENYSLKEETDFLWNIREVYRQLKVISQKADNKIDASYFAANELEAQLKLLSYSIPRRTSAVKGWRNWFYRKKCFDSDYLVLWTNKRFSNFGNSLWLPLGWLLTFHFLAFQLLLFHSTPYRWFLDVNWPDTYRAIELFVLTLSPIHSFTIRLGSEEFNLMGIPDFVSRIVNSYFIFYFLRATRKYHY